MNADTSRMRMQQWTDVFKNLCDKENTACYKTSDFITQDRKPTKVYSSFDEKFKHKLRFNSIHHTCNLYRIDIRINDKIYSPITKRERSSNVFNHSFIILQCQDHFTLFDSWQSMHFATVRKFVKWGTFEKWLNQLTKYMNKAANKYKMDYLHKLFKEQPFHSSNSKSSIKQNEFMKDYKKLINKGEYAVEWPKKYEKELSKQRKIFINIEWIPLETKPSLKK